MSLLVDEIRTFNKDLNLNPIGKPYWKSDPEKRQMSRAGSVAIAFATEAEATRAIRNRLFVAGISVRVEKLYTASPTRQCLNCQGFGHLDHYCRKPTRCAYCAEEHATKQHYCGVCKKTGYKCLHLVPKCANCHGAHTANHRSCETFTAISNKTAITL